jgi:hypothetical protein
MIEVPAGRVRRSGHRDKAKLLDAALELFRRFRRLLHRNKGYTFESLGICSAIFRQPIVVCSRDGAGEIVILQKGQAQKHRRAEVNRRIDALKIHVFQTLQRIKHASGFLRFPA